MQDKQHYKVKYLGSMLVEAISGEAMKLFVIDKIKKMLNRFLASTFRRLFCTVLVQSH